MIVSDGLKRFLEAMDSPIAEDLLTTKKTEKGDYLDYNSGFLTYLPEKNKDEADVWRPRYRVRGRPAKIAKNFCVGEYTDQEYEEFYNTLLGSLFSVKNLTIEKGEDIAEVYLHKMDKRKQSKMLKSCMTNTSGDTSLFEFYRDNPEIVRLLVLWDENSKGEKIAIGRALLWKTENCIYVDRAYGSEPAMAFIKMYVKSKGWAMYGGLTQALGRVIIPHRKEYKRMPYLDTFTGPYYKNNEETAYLLP